MKIIIFPAIGLIFLCVISYPFIDRSQDIKPGDILFYDDFSDTDSDWDIWFEDSGSMINYQNSGLRFVINETQYDYWSTPGNNYSDVRIEVEAIKLDGPDDNNFGLICRFKDSGNFYAFLVSSNGYYGIVKVLDHQYVLIGDSQMQYSELLRQGKGVNQIRADCAGSNLHLYINGEIVQTARDETFASGDVGLIAGSYDEPGVDVFFDNFLVLAPEK